VEQVNLEEQNPMTIALPVVVDRRLVGTAVLIHEEGNDLYFATCLHLFGIGENIAVAIPPHGGNCSAVQAYPITTVPTLPATIVASNPLADLAILLHTRMVANAPPSPVGPIVKAAHEATVGMDVAVLGYPFAPIGSMLETWTPSSVTAKASRVIGPGMTVEEIVLSMTSHPGSSGSAVVGRADGVLYGILRGTLAPPETLRIGEIAVGTDTSITYATSAHLLHELLSHAILQGKELT
jgi:S1-C subfamily serine protease